MEPRTLQFLRVTLRIYHLVLSPVVVIPKGVLPLPDRARDAKRMQEVEAAVTRHTYYIPKELHRELKVQAAQEDRQ